MQRRTLLQAALGGAALSPLAAPAVRAQGSGAGFDHVIRLIIPNAPGGTSDILARLMAPEMTKALGQNVVVENRAGAGGNIGAELVAKSPPDAHTVLLMDLTTLATNPALFPRLGFKNTELAPVSMLIYAPYILGVANNLNIRTAQELAAYAKANPGKLNAANAGTGTSTHLTLVQLEDAFGTPMTHVPYRGGAPALLAVSTGEASITAQGATQSQTFALSGQMRAVAVTGPERMASLPDVPTFKELNWPAAEAGTWQGMMVQANSPPALIAKLHESAREALRAPPVAAKLRELGATQRTDGPQQLAAWLASSTETYTKLIRDHSIQAD
ncbi:Bug family tripartite tricarboxylate transporter substrate binding protein [Roseomonas populi]|uniref:Tripartite tricarboxylate transporter substrate binding protein n=1 Tax=Roseomonas populi TaxID=3121582 RepID=A0ABT1X2Q6_9PROT|nr:tripartite tricarboxylate transporter substrate binding protein [Roseomonas pecuniae]MCR0982386.1 tripartite tricarboxylate transporter substrate binding protein [Roseomonas pecuniae]